MKSYTHIAMTFIALVLSVSGLTVAADPDDAALKKLDQNLAVAKSFEQGHEGGPLVEIEQLVFYLPRDSKVRELIEQKLIDTLQAATTNDAKDFLCRQLRVIATAKSIPALEQLLADPQAVNMAVYALGGLEFPEACQALHRALSKTTGVAQAGIINALADQRFQEAKPDVVKLLGSSETAVAQAAARALGKLGGVDAAEALQAARATAAPELVFAVDEALLECAEGLAAAGARDQAAAIYTAVRSQSQWPQFQLAALRGLVTSRPGDAVQLLVQSIKPNDAALAAEAITMINLVPGSEATGVFAGLAGSLAPDLQVIMLRALGARGDVTAATAIAELVQSKEDAVRLAALEALGSAGNASTVASLVEAVAAGGDGARIAQRSLVRVPGPDVDQTILAMLDQGTEPVRIAAIDAIAGRHVVAAVRPLLKTASAEQAAVRQAAIRALGSLAAPSDLDALLGLVAGSKSAEDRPVWVAAAVKLLSRCEDKDASLTAIRKSLNAAPKTAQPALLLILGATGSEQALPVLRSHLKDASSDNQDAALLALSQWPDARVLDDLLGVIEKGSTPARMESALAGYIRLANASKDPTELFARVLKRVTRTSDKKLVLAGLDAQAQSPGAIELALTYLNDKELGPAAGLAAVHIANRVRDSQEDIARQTLARVIKEVGNEDVRQRAQSVLNEIDRFQGHILDWLAVGPFVEKGKEGAAVYAMVFDPEKPDAKDIKWVPLNKGLGSWDINLEAMFGGQDHCAAYMRTRLWSPQEQDAVLEMGCDDAVKAWVNGKLVHDAWTEHAAAPRQHRADVRLKQGWNDVMLKVVDASGGWVAACRVRAPNGLAIDGLKVEAK